ncbi:hypothetical protein BDN71DRAFT_1594406 [Pleurotus eryngii]|uniref:Uncharacterized protein n=1 Tax=Pleurotus eryngii TaxID=5323 RepID=A0A9P5ZH54_PLEER|nr:hypothetical protein BDN71DRAFT_1594406 [Pleurotus eryngii]
MVESAASKRLQALIRMGCKLLVDTRNLIEEVRIADLIEDVEETERKEIEDGITFLGKVTNTEVATLRRLQRKQQGNCEYEVEEDSWEDIADEVHVVLDNEIITWPPTQVSTNPTSSKRPLERDETDGANEENDGADKPPSKKSKRNGGKRSGRKKGSKDDNPGESGSTNDGPPPTQLTKEEDRVKAHAMQLDFIIRSVNMKHKAGIHSLWRRTIDHENGDHRDEEIASFSRLLQGYTKITTRDMDKWFGEVVRKEGEFKIQVEEYARVNETEDSIERMENWSKASRSSLTTFESKSKVHDLVQNILSIIVQIQMAEDWGSRDRAWKTKYITDSFEVLKHKEIQHARNELTSKEFQGWFEKNRDKYRGIEQKAITARNWTLAVYKEFGSIVLLDSRWNANRYSKDHRSTGFGAFFQYFFANMPHRYAIGDEAANYPEELRYDVEAPMVKYHYGNEDNNDHLVIEIVRFIAGDDSVADYVSDFIKKRRTRLDKRAVGGSREATENNENDENNRNGETHGSDEIDTSNEDDDSNEGDSSV